MLKLLFILMLSLTFSCSKTEEKKTEPRKIINTNDLIVECLRWIERDIYFAQPDPFNTSRNNDFHKSIVKDALKNLEKNTLIGEDYFRIREVNQDLLDPIIPVNTPKNQIKSFILIWPDSQFDAFVEQYRPGGATLVNLPDKNAITVTNVKYQRKFYIILRASCFEGGTRCKGSDNNGIGLNGLSALISRQIAFLLRMSPVNCSSSTSARRNILCTNPSDLQWGTTEQEQLYTAMDGQLTTIENNINFFDDGEFTASCLTTPWMDRDIYPGCYETSGGIRNEPFAVAETIKTLNEIASTTLLKKSSVMQRCKKADISECVDLPSCDLPESDPEYECRKNYFTKKTCVNESSIPMNLDRTAVADNKSYLMIWNSSKLNGFILDYGVGVPDPNGFSIINAAFKKKFKMILRYSCFDTNNPDCDGGNGGITSKGTKALVARQLALMLGINTKDCNDTIQLIDEDNDDIADPFYPEPQSTDVMCSDLPSDAQWRLENRGSLYRYINRLNNYLELIGNNKTFYDQVFDEVESNNTEDN
jgi:hypothetical protein